MKRLLLLSFIAIAIGSCTYDKPEIATISTALPSNCDTTNVTYSGTVKAIITTNCSFASDCHATGGSGTGDLTSYAGVKAKVDNGTFQNRVFVQKNMPPGYGSSKGALSACDLAKLKIWVAQGAPNN